MALVWTRVVSIEWNYLLTFHIYLGTSSWFKTEVSALARSLITHLMASTKLVRRVSIIWLVKYSTYSIHSVRRWCTFRNEAYLHCGNGTQHSWRRSYLRFALWVFGKRSHVTHKAWSLLSGSDTLKHHTHTHYISLLHKYQNTKSNMRAHTAQGVCLMLISTEWVCFTGYQKSHVCLCVCVCVSSYLEACIHSSYRPKVIRGSGSSLR